MVRLHPGKARQQAVVQIDDPAAGVFPAARGGQDSHVAGEHDEIDVVLVAQRDHSLIVRVAGFVADVEPRHFELLGQTAARVAVADHQPRVGLDLSVANRAQQGEHRLGPIGNANRQRAAGDR